GGRRPSGRGAIYCGADLGSAKMSGLHVHRSNRLEALVAILVERLSQDAPELSSPFEPIEVVVGSRGMERYLRHALAERLGICANVRFPFPTAALDRAVHPEGSGGIDPWSPPVLAWALLEVLPEVAEMPEASALRR